MWFLFLVHGHDHDLDKLLKKHGFSKPSKPHPTGLCADCVLAEYTHSLCLSFLFEGLALATCITQWGDAYVKFTYENTEILFSHVGAVINFFPSMLEAHLDWELHHWKLCIPPFVKLQSSKVCPSACSLPGLQCWAPLSFHKIYVRFLDVFTVNFRREISLSQFPGFWAILLQYTNELLCRKGCSRVTHSNCYFQGTSCSITLYDTTSTT